MMYQFERSSWLMPHNHGELVSQFPPFRAHVKRILLDPDKLSIEWGFNAQLRPMPRWFNPNDPRIPFLPYYVTVSPRSLTRWE